jgi:hypothetical protein
MEATKEASLRAVVRRTESHVEDVAKEEKVRIEARMDVKAKGQLRA